MPVAVLPDSSALNSLDTSMVAGYTDCLREALRFLLEKEKLPPQHPVVAGLAMHLASPAVQQALRRLHQHQGQLEESRTTRTGVNNERRVSHSEKSLHSVRGNTSAIGRARLAGVPTVARRYPRSGTIESAEDIRNRINKSGDHRQQPDKANVENSRTISSSAGSTIPSQNPRSQRSVNNQLRLRFQTIIQNLQEAIDGSEDDSSEEEEDYDEDDGPIYDLDENDIDTEIETILGDAELRRELVRLVYQGCDVVAVAPHQSVPYPSPPCSPLYAEVATPQYLPDEHIIEHIPNDRM